MDCPSIKVIPIPRGAQYITQEVTFEFMHLDCRFLVSLEPFRHALRGGVGGVGALISRESYIFAQPYNMPANRVVVSRACSVLGKEVLHRRRNDRTEIICFELFI